MKRQQDRSIHSVTRFLQGSNKQESTARLVLSLLDISAALAKQRIVIAKIIHQPLYAVLESVTLGLPEVAPFVCEDGVDAVAMLLESNKLINNVDKGNI